jgi:hypothetical protein
MERDGRDATWVGYRSIQLPHIQYSARVFVKYFQELPPYSDDETVQRYKFYLVHEFIYIHMSTNFFL